MSWARWQPSKQQPWNRLRVVHLHRRAGFGANWDQIEQDVADGPDAAIDRVVASPAERVQESYESLMRSLGDSAVGSNDPNRLKAWWFLRMLRSPRPLTEKLTLMWHNHFATSNAKVLNLAAMRRQNELFRQHASGSFVDLLSTVVHDPAMLTWLDAPLNRKGRPNENLARELMELFTLGIGNYSETDVREAARALTGWTVKGDGFAHQDGYHDKKSKRILKEEGSFDGDDLLRILWKHPATSKRIAWRICQTLMGENAVDDAAINALAEQLRDQDLNIGKAVETVLRSEYFFAEGNIGTRIACPVELIMSCVKACEIHQPSPSSMKLMHWSTELGQDLFYPPNVGGWSGGRNWLSTRQIIARANFAIALCEGKLPTRKTPLEVKQLVRSGGSVADGIVFFDQLLLGGRLSKESRMRIESAVKDDSVAVEEQLRRALALLMSLPECQVA